MRESSAYDVVIVGAGPAGSATAIRLATAGQRVLLLDRSPFPRSKPCGECLNPGAVSALADLGLLESVTARGGSRLRGWQIRPLRGPSFAGSLPPDRAGFAIPRSRLDLILLDAAREAGAEVRIGTRVTDLLWRDGSVAGVRCGSDAIPARLVVGADGLRSVVVRRLKLLRRPPRLRKVALAAHVTGASDSGEWGRLVLREFGCIGIVDVGGGMTNVVVVLHGSHVARIAGRPEAAFDAALAELPELRSARREDAVRATGPFDWPTRSAIADGALLVGDAAGYFDPFTGQGIFRALRGAELAAAAAADALRSGDCSVTNLRRYERSRRDAFRSGERVQRLVELVVARPSIFAGVAELLAERPSLADGLIEVIGDIRSATSFLDLAMRNTWKGAAKADLPNRETAA